jgi:hypothetical protein
MCPITGISAQTSAFSIPARRRPPSIFTASAPASWIRRPALRIVSSAETWYDRKGMSATISAAGRALATAAV